MARALRIFRDMLITESGGGLGAGGDGGGDNNPYGFTVFPSVYNNGGVVARVSYMVELFEAGLIAQFAALGFATETGFVVNSDGVATTSKLVTSLAPLGPLPFGVAEYNTMLTKTGLVNVPRYIIRFGP
jgi:hypothetical protein